MRRIMSIISALGIVACVHEGLVYPDEGKVMMSLKAAVDGADGHVSAKSILTEGVIEDKVTDLTVASYDENGVLVDAQYYTDLSDIKLYISKNGENNIFAMANMGDMTDAMPSDVSEVGGVSYVLTSYSDVEKCGIPMCASMKVTLSMQSPEIKLVRLFAKVNLRILHTSLDNSNSLYPYAYNLCNKSVYIRQANKRLFPFAASGSRALTEDDIMSESDYNADMNDRTVHVNQAVLGPGPGYWQDTTIVMYVPENMQGVLLPANTDPYAKSGDKISSINGLDYSGLCTYVELNTRKEGIGTGLSGGVTYRCYLGADNVTDFNVERNGRYDVTLDLTQESFGLDNWKVVKGDDWSDTRSIEFLSDSYIIYPGTSKNVFVHYNTQSGVGSDSQIRPGEWIYSFDEEGMAAAGISYVHDPGVLTASPASANDICFTFTASASAVTGTGFPLKVALKDGSIEDHSMIYIAESGDLTPNWNGMPLYVAQYGVVKVDGGVALPLSAAVSDPSVLSCTAIDDESFRVVALRPGESDITFTGNGGTQSCTVHLKVSAPVLDITTEAVALNPDGAQVQLDYNYVDARGERLSGFDEDAFRTYLLPVVDDNDYFTTGVTSDKVTLMIGRLYDDVGAVIDIGAPYDLKLKAADCEASGSQDIRAYVVDPFDDIVPADFGRIDDYTLFMTGNTDSNLKKYFSADRLSNESFEYEAPLPDADRSCIKAGLVPEWSLNFSNPNEVYAIAYDGADDSYSTGASFKITQNSVTTATRHSAGRHDVMLYVVNRHSQDEIGHVCGHIGIYVHTALGARAEFGSQVCNYKPEGSGADVPCFADVYNEVIGRTQFSAESGKKIYYMDVNAEFMTDVNRVFVFERLSVYAGSGSNIFDAISVLQPGVADGEADANTGMMYSVSGTGGHRITVAGEDYGTRKGIGVMLYRALRLQAYDHDHTDTDFNRWFLGLSVNNVASSIFAPCYNIHDMMKGSDMSLNIVERNEPYYFAPSDHPSKVDAEGKGYHVIHFLEDIYPDTGGWINLL